MTSSKVGNILIFAIGLLSLLPIAGCTPRQSSKDQAPEYRVDIEISPEPATVGSTLLNIQVLNEEGAPVDSIALTVRGDMTHAGMTPVIERAEPEGSGEYSVEFEWTMAGSWLVTLNGTLPDGRELIRIYPVDVNPNSSE